MQSTIQQNWELINGKSWLKDYNGQNYWLSVNPASFLSSNTSFPQWLNLSVGIGAEGMIGARTNPSKIGNVSIPTFKRQHRFLFSADVDLKRIDNPDMEPPCFAFDTECLKVPGPDT
jgi:hypothetical protein